MALPHPQKPSGQSGGLTRQSLQRKGRKRRRKKRKKNCRQIDQYRNPGPFPKLQRVIGKNWRSEPDLYSTLFLLHPAASHRTCIFMHMLKEKAINKNLYYMFTVPWEASLVPFYRSLTSLFIPLPTISHAFLRIKILPDGYLWL